MEIKEIEEITIGFLVEEFEAEPADIVPEANLIETLELDSLDYVDLVANIQSNFNFKVNPEDFKTIVTFQDFYDYIETKMKETVA